MKSLVQYTWFRVIASAVVATVVIVGVVGGAIRYYDQRPEEDPLLSELEYVKVVNLAENPALAEAIRKEREKHGEPEPSKLPPPPVLPDREISGFVQVEYTINPDGTVSDVRVVGAAPAGVYEEQAVARIKRSMHAPVYNDAGEPVARRMSEVIEFSVPASELVGSE